MSIRSHRLGRGVALLMLSACGSRFGHLERRSAELDRIAPPGTRVERIAKGFEYTEGPQWMPGGYLLFGDLPNNVIWRWDTTGKVTVARTRSGFAAADHPPGDAMGSNGMALDGEGRLTVCEPGNRRITRTETDGSITVLVDRYRGKRLNSPNDLVYRYTDGSLYFTDPPTGLLHEDQDSTKELPFNGVYRVHGDTVQLLDSTLTRPNGIGFSPDERVLYISNADANGKIWRRYDVLPDGSIANGRTILDLTGERGQPPDGLEVDEAGNLYLTGPGGLWITSPTGKVLGVIRTRSEPSNVAWGGPDRRTLYLTATYEVYRVRLGIPGAAHQVRPR